MLSEIDSQERNIQKQLSKACIKLYCIKAATGGGISGEDTVPALLTPGEFVFSKKVSK